MAIVFIDPGAAPGGDGSVVRPYADWWQVSFQAGDTYVQRAGTVASVNLVIDAQGSAEAPIVIGSYGEGAAPVIEGMINLDGAAHVTVMGMTVRNSGAAAVTLQGGANHITILGNTLTDSAVGVWIGNGAGGDNLVALNEIVDSALVGIAVAGVANAAGHETVIASNTVTGSGTHGIGINGSNFLVLGNRVSGSGHIVSGSSGIHVWGGFEGAPDGFGVGNAILGNVVDGTIDRDGYDGNGIQLDQYANGNVVVGNLATGNDGAGISLFDAHGNVVAGNVAEGNQLDSGGTHAIRADILLVGSMDMTDGNIISGNVALSGLGPAVLVDTMTADNANLFTGNVWQNSAGEADTMLGPDGSWAAWLANPLTGGAGLTPDAETGVPLAIGDATDPMGYAFGAGTVRVIDGMPLQLLGWADGVLVVSGEAVM